MKRAEQRMSFIGRDISSLLEFAAVEKGPRRAYLRVQPTPKAIEFSCSPPIGCKMAVYSMSPVSRPIASDPTAILQQEIRTLAASGEVRTAHDWFRKREPEFARWHLEGAQIAAPPFGENARADWLANKLAELGLKDVRRDGIGNGSAIKPGSNIPPVSISAHIDT